MGLRSGLGSGTQQNGYVHVVQDVLACLHGNGLLIYDPNKTMLTVWSGIGY
jgi:hypothetical protein